ncbi:right-handed parallel beta-helix repeat-containing protein [bacterium]|nr:right-handed parallel beta-helix repeat-containing protein [bacterium]
MIKALIYFCLISLPSIALSADYYVATDGNDANPGTLALPFASIQHAVDQSIPGSTLYLRAGTYRQIINFDNHAGTPSQPITLTPHNEERVTIDGTFEITSSWTHDTGDIYTTTLADDITQLFVDGNPMTLARHPNASAFSDNAFREGNRLTQSGSSPNGTVTGSADLAANNINFTDCIALLNFKSHVTWARLIKNHNAGSNTFNYTAIDGPVKTHQYFMEGGIGNAERIMLDTAEEWAFDESTKTLSLWTANGLSPAGRSIFAKGTTAYALTGNAATHDIIIDGLNFFATTFYFHSSDNITVQNCRFDYPSASKRALGDISTPLSSHFQGFETDRCENPTVFNCTFHNSDASALRTDHAHNALVENCLFERIDYAPIGVSGAVNMRQSPGSIFRRNTINISGEAMAVVFEPTSGNLTEPWTFEYNFHTKCGLMETDGSSVYAAHEAIVESVARHSWFIGNDARDFRWDGNNTPVLLGKDANFYRNVMMADRIKGIATDGDGARLKGDFHEVYNNVGIYNWSDIDVSEDKGGNDNTLARNNVATKLTGDINDPARASTNIPNGNMGLLLRDPDNWDFRPRSTASALIDQGTETNCSVNGASIDVTAGFLGAAPDIGVYEFGETSYWIPGRQEAQAAMPVPRIDGEFVQLDTDLMYLIGLGGVSANIHFGSDPQSLNFLTSKTDPENIVTLSEFTTLQGNTTYYWRVDTVLADATIIPGQLWSFTTKIAREFMPWLNRTASGAATWNQQTQSGDLVYNNNSEQFLRRALIYSTPIYQSDSGFKLTVGYTTGTIGDDLGHNLSFGLISTDTNLTTYSGFNPFKADTSVYSIGVNLTADGSTAAQGLNFTNGSSRTTLDHSGSHVQFGSSDRLQTNESNIVVIEIGPNGCWRYTINGITEATGIIAEGFDLSKSYRVAVYGQDDNGDGKSIQHLSLETDPSFGNEYDAWASQHGLGGTNALIEADADGDDYNNLLEFALGMNPTLSDPGSKESLKMESQEANDFLVFHYDRRSDYVTAGLTYSLVVTTDLQTQITTAPFEITVGQPLDGFETVTTRLLLDDPKKFIQLKVEMK